MVQLIPNSLRWLVGTALVSLLVTGLRSHVVVNDPPRILVFSKTAAFRHASIGAGQKALLQLGKEKGFAVDTTENADHFTEENLKRYRAVVFLNTTGDVLNTQQQNTFERYIQAGGGYLGIHAATDTEYDWPWYNKLAGAWFANHPTPDNVQKGTFVVVDKTNPATHFLPERWEREDEFYSFRDISPALHVLLTIDEKTYRGGTNGDNHPMAWYQEFEGGRSFYTAGGHTDATFSEPLFLRHLGAGLDYVMGGHLPNMPDLTPNIILPQANFATTGDNAIRNFTVELRELNEQPTSSGNVVFTITAPLGYSLAFDETRTTIDISGGAANAPVDNTKWTVTAPSALQLQLTIKPGQFIAASANATLGFTITRTTANPGSSANITVGITDDANQDYDSVPANNIFSRVINALAN